MKGMRSIKRPGWTLQLYWPSLWFGPVHYGIKADTSLMINMCRDWRSAGFVILGFGVGFGWVP